MKNKFFLKISGMAVLLLYFVTIFFVSCVGSDGIVEKKSIDSTVKMLIERTDQSEHEVLESIFYYVRDEIEFNWVFPQDIPPEEVLNNGYGVCMQKANLFAAMAKAAGFETRFHFVFVEKKALEDFLPDFAYDKWLDPFPHTVVEVKLNDRWVSFDPSFDKTLHEICLAEKLNFGKYAEIRSQISTDFSLEGVKGAQEFWEVENIDGFYGTDLQPLIAFDKANVPLWKRILKPTIFKKAHEIMDEIRDAM